MIDTVELVKTFVILLAIIDPIGNIPVVMVLTGNKSDDEYRSIILKTSCAVVILLSVSFLFGKYFLIFFGIKMPAFELVGGVFLLYVAFTMLVNSKISFLYPDDAEEKEHIAFMPMTFPLLVGPAAMSSVIIQSHNITAWQVKLIFIGEFILIGILVGLTLGLAKIILNNLGKTGIKFITQTMGLLLGSLAIGLITDALKLLLPGLS
ncbi:MAG TPA: MarC family protein [Nitrospina sp.]|jgi:multiple antibiotic resistance protein|nr:MarC family protein [Nitrospina sp.]|tara:strand:+ start:92 stop:712 length:621 start_codon:yes stop_codon:yes gene_type:complete